jgi:hypothetical protein
MARHGKEAKNIAEIAAARELLSLVFYGMRDGRVRYPRRAPGRRHDRQRYPGARPPSILPLPGRLAQWRARRVIGPAWP